MSDDGWWKNDSQVFAGEPLKVYHARGGMPGARITVSVLADQETGLFEGAA